MSNVRRQMAPRPSQGAGHQRIPRAGLRRPEAERRAQGGPQTTTDALTGEQANRSSGGGDENRSAATIETQKVDHQNRSSGNDDNRSRGRLKNILVKMRTLGISAIVGGVATFAVGVYFDFIDLEMKSKEDVANRISAAQERLESSKLSDQLSGIDDFQRAAQDYPDHALKRAIDRIALFLQLRTDIRKGTSCGSPDTTLLATSALTAIGELNNGDVGIIDLRYTCLTNVDSPRLNLRNVDFAHAILSHAAFLETDLRGARFDYARLDGTQFAEVNLAASSLCYADFSKADFRSGTILTGALVDRKSVQLLAVGNMDTSRTNPCP